MSGNTTPRPWEVKNDHLVIDPNSMTYVADCALSDEEDESINVIMARAKANSELIVRAVNAHQDLVNVLLQLILVAGNTETVWGDNRVAVHEFGMLLSNARLALAKARGDQS